MIKFFFLITFLTLNILSPLNALADTYVMGTLGDSISTGFNAKKLRLIQSKIYSWSTGWGTHEPEPFESHLTKIKNLLPNREVIAHNVAVPGAKTRNIKKQIANLFKKSAHYDYVTLMIGCNDICGRKTGSLIKISTYERRITKAIKSLVDRHPNIKINIIPISNMISVYETMKDNKWCRFAWKNTHACNPLLKEGLTEEQRDAVMDHVRDMNNALERVYKKYKNNILFNKHLSFYEFTEEFVSEIDCFHPSVFGQLMISELSWDPEWLFPDMEIDY